MLRIWRGLSSVGICASPILPELGIERNTPPEGNPPSLPAPRVPLQAVASHAGRDVAAGSPLERAMHRGVCGVARPRVRFLRLETSMMLIGERAAKARETRPG